MLAVFTYCLLGQNIVEEHLSHHEFRIVATKIPELKRQVQLGMDESLIHPVIISILSSFLFHFNPFIWDFS